MLFVSSYDGYASAAAFSPEDFGEPLAAEELPATYHRIHDLTFAPSNKESAAATSNITPASGEKTRARIAPTVVSPAEASGTAAASNLISSVPEEFATQLPLSEAPVTTLVPRKRVAPLPVETAAPSAAPSHANRLDSLMGSAGDAPTAAGLESSTPGALNESTLPSMFTIPAMGSPARKTASPARAIPSSQSPARKRIAPIPVEPAKTPEQVSGTKTKRDESDSAAAAEVSPKRARL
jgi:hypothetical protein